MLLMGFNVSVIKLVFVAPTVNLTIYCLIQFKLNSANFNTTQIDTTSMRKAQHLFRGVVYSREAFI
jgi:hypothetical protein